MSDAGEEARRALEEYRAKAARELPDARDGLPAGNPDSGVLLVLEPPHTPAVLEALALSLDSVRHPDARVVPAGAGILEEILSGGPAAIAAVGPGAAHALDALEYPLSHARFSDPPAGGAGRWFLWSKGVRGLALPALAPALEDEEAKRAFWRAFLALRALEPA